MIAWTAIYAGMLDISYQHSVCVPVLHVLRVHDDRMRLPEEKSSAKSTVSVSAPHTKTAERIVSKNSVLQQFLVTLQ